MFRRLLFLFRPQAPQRPEFQVEPAQEAVDGQGTGASGAGRQIGVPGLHGPAGRAAVLPAGGADGRIVLGTRRRGQGRGTLGQRGGGVRTAHRTAQRASADATGPGVRAAHQEATGAGQKSHEETSAHGRPGHQRIRRVRRRIVCARLDDEHTARLLLF